MKKMNLIVVLIMLLCGWTYAQTDNGVVNFDEFRSSKKREIINIPNIPGYQTLKCDFHMHTVFSDGKVWPIVRAQEAWREGMDAIAITDHIEHTPHSGDVKIGHNRAYELGKDVAERCNLLFIKGAEITRLTPPGHFNAIFIDDASGYISDKDRSMDKAAVAKAAQQNAFIFWNHPGWKIGVDPESYDWLGFIEELHHDKMLHGIEVFNGFKFHKKALDWCVDKNLTVMGSTDMHDLVAHEYDQDEHVHRTMTLVFAKDRTSGSVREALEKGRTVAWASKYLAGREEHVRNLFDACVNMGPSFHAVTGKNKNGDEVITNYYEISNNSDLYFELELKTGQATRKVVLSPQSSQIITAKAGQTKLTYEVVTAYVRSDKYLTVDFVLD